MLTPWTRRVVRQMIPISPKAALSTITTSSIARGATTTSTSVFWSPRVSENAAAPICSSRCLSLRTRRFSSSKSSSSSSSSSSSASSSSSSSGGGDSGRLPPAPDGEAVVPSTTTSRRVNSASSSPRGTTRGSPRSKDSRIKSTRRTDAAAFSHFPSVPSTENLGRSEVHVASFFSLHRPISIDNPFPSQASLGQFARVFRQLDQPSPPPPPSTRTSLTSMRTEGGERQDSASPTSVGSRVHTILLRGNASSRLSSSSPASAHALDRSALVHALRSDDSTGPDGISVLDRTNLHFQRPFNPPPPPNLASVVTEAHPPPSAIALDNADVERVLTHTLPRDDVVTEEPFDEATIAVVETPTSQSAWRRSPYLERRQRRLLLFRAALDQAAIFAGQINAASQSIQPLETDESAIADADNVSTEIFQPTPTLMPTSYHAISVKRQRRLKMKKHKYKKLMKRTRNLRRREGRL